VRFLVYGGRSGGSMAKKISLSAKGAKKKPSKRAREILKRVKDLKKETLGLVTELYESMPPLSEADRKQPPAVIKKRQEDAIFALMCFRRPLAEKFDQIIGGLQKGTGL